MRRPYGQRIGGRPGGGEPLLRGGVQAVPAGHQLVVQWRRPDQLGTPPRHRERERGVEPGPFCLSPGLGVGRSGDDRTGRDVDAGKLEPYRTGAVSGAQTQLGGRQPGLGAGVEDHADHVVAGPGRHHEQVDHSPPADPRCLASERPTTVGWPSGQPGRPRHRPCKHNAAFDIAPDHAREQLAPDVSRHTRADSGGQQTEMLHPDEGRSQAARRQFLDHLAHLGVAKSQAPGLEGSLSPVQPGTGQSVQMPVDGQLAGVDRRRVVEENCRQLVYGGACSRRQDHGASMPDSARGHALTWAQGRWVIIMPSGGQLVKALFRLRLVTNGPRCGGGEVLGRFSSPRIARLRAAGAAAVLALAVGACGSNPHIGAPPPVTTVTGATAGGVDGATSSTAYHAVASTAAPPSLPPSSTATAGGTGAASTAGLAATGGRPSNPVPGPATVHSTPPATTAPANPYGTATGPKTKNAHWNLPATVTKGTSLVSVSCPAKDFCAAVGDHGMASTFNGATWAPPRPVGAKTLLASVSCPSTTFCVAMSVSGHVTYYRHGAWSGNVVVDPSGEVNQLSCPTKEFCAGVGFEGQAFTYHSGTWSKPQLVDTGGELQAVSCTSATFCVAGGSEGEVLTYNGSSWSAPRTVDTAGAVEAISCVATDFCALVGYKGSSAFFNGTSWGKVKMSTSEYGLNSISCTSAKFCLALETQGAIAYTYANGKWSTSSTMDPVGDPFSVSCVKPSFCVVVDDSGHAVIGD